MDVIECLLNENNFPSEGKIEFISSDHVRYKNGVDVSGHNFGCKRKLIVEKNINGGEVYTITIFNLDSIHPLWGNNIQMAPKQMRILFAEDNVVQLRGFGYDQMGGAFSDYGLLLLIKGDEIIRAQLNMYDRNISIVYLK